MEIILAKNGQKTARQNDYFLHSSYNPKMEAERFVNNLTLPFNCAFILITEPALSYIAEPLKKKYPQKKIICIRYIPDFYSYNIFFDDVINFFEHRNDFSNFLINKFGEENIFKIFFIKWEASAKAFEQIDTEVWTQIKNALEKSKTLLVTRQYFEKKWLLNSLTFLKYAKNFYQIKKINKPILILASGPSLKSILQHLQKMEDNFFIICLSSAISVLEKYKIKPDLYFSIDGGFWAGEHLKSLCKKNDIPLAISLESFCQKTILESSKIILLNYQDGISSDFIKHFNIKSIDAKRNGTVTGTALDFSLEFGENDIYISGLDLSAKKNFSHTQPNEIEKNNALFDNKINSLEKRIFKSSLNSQSLEIYKDWFCKKDLQNKKVFRIINENEKTNKLGKIKDISVFDFLKIKKEKFFKQNYFEKSNIQKIDKNELKRFALEKLNEESVQKQIFPMDFISIFHNPNDKSTKQNLDEKIKKLKEKILEILN